MHMRMKGFTTKTMNATESAVEDSAFKDDMRIKRTHVLPHVVTSVLNTSLFEIMIEESIMCESVVSV